MRLRWYVEGETEAGAIERFVEEYGLGQLIQVVNYHGQIRGGRTEAFCADLQRDLAAGVFSYVSVDGDEENVLRVVRQAAAQDLICGEYFVANPDFEYANFKPAELVEVAWEMSTGHDSVLNASAGHKAVLHRAVQGCRSGKEFEREVQSALPEGSEPFSKGERWGRCLMEHAMKRPRMPDGGDRPVIEAVWKAVTARNSSYRLTRDRMRIDTGTGQLVER